jgi:glycosyltransferase involved in cell wall biosynthesis
MNQSRPIRILQVVGGMPRHGSETWLMHVLRHIDRQQFQMDFLVHTLDSHAYDDEIRALGSRIIPCLQPSKPWLYAKYFKQVLQEYGAYDIVHSHIHHYSGFVLRLAHQEGIPVRIAHSHSDTSHQQAQAGFLRRLYLSLMSRWIRDHATVGLAASQRAAAALFGRHWQSDRRWQTLHCGIDLAPFREPSNSIAVRTELGIALDAFVIGHVGRFVEVKNHTFLVDILAEIVRREPKACLLLVGEGFLRSEIEQKVARLGLSNHVVFAGARSDVPQLMRGAMDAFVFPSFYEGLPLSLIEAQAAGLPCFFSDGITQEVSIIQSLTQQLSLSQSASDWSEVVLETQRKIPAIIRSAASEELKQTEFNILNGLRKLEELYGKSYQLN